MTLHEVNNILTINQFSYLPHKIYASFPHYIYPIRRDVESIFDKTLNSNFEHGICKRWVLRDEQNEVIGRIAAFIDFKQSKKEKQPTGGIGFFECIDNQEAANILFEIAHIFLEEQGVEAMDGPINFGDRSAWWGLLVEGFNSSPIFRVNYHPPYYKKLFETYGFQVYFYQYTYQFPTILSERFFKVSKRVMRNSDYTFNHIDLKQLDKFSQDFCVIYNGAWIDHGVEPISTDTVKKTLNDMKFIMDPETIWVAYHKDKPVSFFITLPDINYIFQYLQGDFGAWSKIKLLWYKKFKPIKKICGLAFGTLPEFQNKGLEVTLTTLVYEKFKQGGYETFELSWVGSFHKKMIAFSQLFSKHPYKTHATYRKLFDTKQPFESHPDISC